MSVMTPASFGALTTGYARRDVTDEKWPDVAKIMSRNPGTSCCVQMSRAFGQAGLKLEPRSYRRKNEYFDKLGWYALLAVDEVEDFLTLRFGEGEDYTADAVRRADPLQRPAILAEAKKKLAGRTGVLVFRQAKRRTMPPDGMFEHTELWSGSDIIQQDMNREALFSSEHVLFWSTNDAASWLKAYMGS